MDEHELSAWEARFAQFIEAGAGEADAAHDGQHVRRVVTNAKRLMATEGADAAVVLPAAWLHDCVHVPKHSPDRARASTMAAERATGFLQESGYPPDYIPAIAHAIAAHSFTAGIAPETAEARVVQDADRLDALGAIGTARTLMLGGTLSRPLYDTDEPFPVARRPDDRANVLDHFYVKLLALAETMQTATGRREAAHRTAFMRAFLDQLQGEIEA